jgi:MFS family permease
MILIDETAVSVALPTIQRDLHMSPSGLQWVVNSYLLTLACCVAVGGRLGELLGQARMFRLGAVAFVAASAGCGLAGSGAWLIAARTAQGLAAAAMMPASGAIVINAFGAGERGRAMGTYAGISTISLALGPLLGGLLTQGITWRAVFWINLPVGLAMLALAQSALPDDDPGRGAVMDWPGAATLVPGLVAIVLALTQTAQWGWASPATIALLGGGAALLAAFIVTEAHRSSPLVQLKLFASRNFSAGTAVLGCVQFTLIGLTVFGAIYAQEILGFGPITAGLALLPVMLPVMLLSPAAGRAYDRLGPPRAGDGRGGIARHGRDMDCRASRHVPLCLAAARPGADRDRDRAGHDPRLDGCPEHRAAGLAGPSPGRHPDPAAPGRLGRPGHHGHRGGKNPAGPTGRRCVRGPRRPRRDHKAQRHHAGSAQGFPSRWHQQRPVHRRRCRARQRGCRLGAAPPGDPRRCPAGVGHPAIPQTPRERGHRCGAVTPPGAANGCRAPRTVPPWRRWPRR